jgi:hypothetical protein
MNTKLRLLITEKCNRRCKGCCNEDWDLSKVPLCGLDFEQYDYIMITGGEPMLFPSKIFEVVRNIRISNPRANIYMYTAKVDNLVHLMPILDILDGICLTLHEQTDVGNFYILDMILRREPYLLKRLSLRLNIFKGIDVKINRAWKVKDNMEWIKDCQLPEGEDFKRLTEWKEN